MTTWLNDDNGNRCSVEYFGTKEAAQAALDSLENCKNCTNCSRCSGCSRCSRCSGCSRCSRCSRCSGCSRCSDCSRCSRCSGCSNVAVLHNRKNLKGDPESTWTGPPPIPSIENIHTKVYKAASGDATALDMSTWHHACGTTHCRGGWVVHLAGEAGKKLEEFHGSLLAAQLIYGASGYEINPCRFFDGNKEALADIKKLAEGE